MFKNLVERYNGACFALAKKNGGNSISFIGSAFYHMKVDFLSPALIWYPL